MLCRLFENNANCGSSIHDLSLCSFRYVSDISCYFEVQSTDCSKTIVNKHLDLTEQGPSFTWEFISQFTSGSWISYCEDKRRSFSNNNSRGVNHSNKSGSLFSSLISIVILFLLVYCSPYWNAKDDWFFLTIPIIHVLPDWPVSISSGSFR